MKKVLLAAAFGLALMPNVSRAADASPQAAAKEITRNGGIPFAAFVSDPCDGRSQGTHGMFDSLPYRNDAAIVFRRLIRSLPTRRAVIGISSPVLGLRPGRCGLSRN